MIYRSNLTAPDLVPNFKHVRSEPEQTSFGHDVLHDWADGGYPVEGENPPGFLTHDEAAILYNVASRFPGAWLDIGAHTGWTTAHVEATGSYVTSVEPLDIHKRFRENVGYRHTAFTRATSFLYFSSIDDNFLYDGVMIDGDHCPGEPLVDAILSAAHLKKRGAIVFHDFIGGPVQEAATWLMDRGFNARVYFTPFMLAVCWRGDFTPPDHTPDPNLPDLKDRCPGFDFARCI